MSDAKGDSKPLPIEVKTEETEEVLSKGKEGDDISKIKNENDPELTGQCTVTATQDVSKGDGQKGPDKGNNGQSGAVDTGVTNSATSADADITVRKDRDSSELEAADPGKPTEDPGEAAKDENKCTGQADEDDSSCPEKADKDERNLPEKADKAETGVPKIMQVKLEPLSPGQISEETSCRAAEQTRGVAMADDNSTTKLDNIADECSNSHVDDMKPKVPSPKEVRVKEEEAVCENDNSILKTEVAGERTDSTNEVKVDNDAVKQSDGKENVTGENENKENLNNESKGPVVGQIEVMETPGKMDHAQTNKESSSNMGVVLSAVKIEENEPSMELKVEAKELKENNYGLSEEATVLANDVPKATEGEKMQVDDASSAPETAPDSIGQKKEALMPEVPVTESKAVHEIIAEQSARTERESVTVPSAPIEKIENASAPEPSSEPLSVPSSVPHAPETKVEIKEVVDEDWDIPASDEEEECSDIPEGESEKKKRVVVKRGYWEPPAEVIVELYKRLDKEGILELSWKCPGRRPPSVEGDEEEEKEQLEEDINEEEMEISQEEEDPTEFDFDIDTDSSVQKMTPRRGIGSGQAQGSGKKRVARMDKVLSDIFRHRKIDSAMTDVSKAGDVPMETGEAMDTTPASDVTPSRSADKFHIRSDLT